MLYFQMRDQGSQLGKVDKRSNTSTYQTNEKSQYYEKFNNNHSFGLPIKAA